MTKMNPEIKQQWVQALRSGEYRQGRLALCCDGKFCCLGVLSDLAVKAGVTKWLPTHYGIGVEDLEEPQGINISSLAPPVRAWSGVEGDEEFSLMKLNDVRRATFPEIAHYIEENL